MKNFPSSKTKITKTFINYDSIYVHNIQNKIENVMSFEKLIEITKNIINVNIKT